MLPRICSRIFFSFMFDISFSEFFSSERPDSVSTHCNCATSTACTKSDIRT